MQFRTISFLLILLTAAACSGKQEGGAPAGAGAVKEYKVISVRSQSTTLFKDYPTTLEGQQTVEIRPKVAGYIEQILVDEGATVKKGEILFRLNAADLQAQVRSAEAQVKVAEAQVNTAKIQVDQTQPLVDKKIISDYQLETSQAALTSAEAQLAQAKANLENAKANLQYTIITSPTNGLIGNFPYRVGSLVSSTISTPLTTVSDTKNMYAYFAMNEKDFVHLLNTIEGKSIQEKLAKMPEVNLVLADNTTYDKTGEVQTASGLIDQETGSVNIRATFPNPDGLLRSGGSGLVRITQHLDSVLIIPQNVTFELQGKHFVYTVDAENKVHSTSIDVIVGNLKDSYVVTNGLTSGDKVVIEGIASLRNDVEIKPNVVESTNLAENVASENPAKN